jgi:nucleoside-diphosphate-sugar epimerase
MRVLILGGDGYLGWPTALHLSAIGHDVAVADNFARRGYDYEMGVDSPVPNVVGTLNCCARSPRSTPTSSWSSRARWASTAPVVY